MTINIWIATLAWCLLMIGYYKRRERRFHIPLVLSGIILDYALVLYLQFTRDAIQTAISFKLTLLQQMHIGVSTIAILMYLPIIWFGLKLVNGTASPMERALHGRLARFALALRTLGFGLMFSMIGGVVK